ncbi:hypothetical protein COCON_G00109930 [Conger conger]|uniref:Uncharacterized protein n=1 Tax=Conger conger TaxID=82655 RepID=A0A9Q1DJF4_CONCO|nr:hypothetical protein COCON_G00109930 [Conger conger]
MLPLKESERSATALRVGCCRGDEEAAEIRGKAGSVQQALFVTVAQAPLRPAWPQAEPHRALGQEAGLRVRDTERRLVPARRSRSLRTQARAGWTPGDVPTAGGSVALLLAGLGLGLQYRRLTHGGTVVQGLSESYR